MTTDIAVVGLAARVGEWADVGAVERALYAGQPCPRHLPPGQPIPREQSLLEVADQALRDARLSEGMNLSILVAGEPEPLPHQNTGDGGTRIASHAAERRDPDGPALAISEEAVSVFQVLDQARRLLLDSLDVVVVCAADVVGAPPPDVSSQGDARWPMGDGAVAVVLMRAERARGDGRRVYATIEAMHRARAAGAGPATGDSEHPGQNAATVERACREALRSAGVTGSEIGYLEISGGSAGDGAAALVGFARALTTTDPWPHCALGTNGETFGRAGTLADLLSVIGISLALHGRYRPAGSGALAALAPDEGGTGPLYVLPRSSPWLTASGPRRRIAVIGGLDATGTANCVILAQADAAPPSLASSATAHEPPWSLLPILADDLPSLLGALDDLEMALGNGASVAALANRALTQMDTRATSRHVLSLVGRGADDLLREIELARGGIARAFESDGSWVTPQGSYFTARPLGTMGGTALVYPGGFSSYLGQGRQLYRLFPDLADRVSELLPEEALAVADRTIFPRSLAPLDAAALATLERGLADDTFAVVAAGASFAVAGTLILREPLGLQPTATLGYSFGEATALWAHGIWSPRHGQGSESDETVARATRVLSPEVAMHELWGVAPDGSDDLWQSFVLLARPERVVEALAGETRAYLTIITAPEEVVIAGEAAACRRVVERLGCRAARAPYNRVLHVEPLRPAYDAFLELYRMPVERRPEVAFYSAGTYAPLTLEQESIARALARTLSHPLDFPRLVRRVYEDGVRIFVELGPGSLCSRWIRSTLRGQEHVALSLDQKGADGQASLVRVLATLVCHRVPLDLQALRGTAGCPGPRVEAPVRMTPATVAEPGAPRWTFPLPDASPAHRAHLTMLRARLDGARQLRDLLELQLRRLQAACPTPGGTSGRGGRASCRVETLSVPNGKAAPLIDEAGVREWATGSFEACFGPAYRVYDQRRAPRSPNGDLQLISRALGLDGERGRIQPGSSLTTEFDVPSDPWFYRENAFPDIPYSILMELALQPCGFLSSLLGSTLLFPESDFYFRNLDGRGRLLRSVDLRGRTVRAYAGLLSSVAMEGAIIQRFEFALRSDGEPLFIGDTTSGYFTRDALAHQVGLDDGQTIPPWIGQHPEAERLELRPEAALGFPWMLRPQAERPHYRLAGQHFELLDRFVVVKGGGRFGLGAVYADRQVRADDWFFACHVYQDPVMPGSLGLEAIIAALQAFALRLDLGARIASPRFGLPVDHEVTWKYRGQILPTDDWLSLEVEITRIETRADRITLVGDASVWRNHTRIYEVTNVAICIAPSRQRAT